MRCSLVQVESLLSGCEYCSPREGSHCSGLSIVSSSHLGSFTESISKNQSWGKGKCGVTTLTRRKFSAASGLSTSQTKEKKNKNKAKPSSSGGKSQCNSAERWAAGSLVAPRLVCFDCNARLSCRCGWFRLNRSPVVQRSQQRSDHNNQQLVIYHNHIQNHKRQSSLKYIRDIIYLFIKACQGFVITQLLPCNPN